MTKRAVIYCRVSSDEQTRGFSLSTQLASCLKYAEDKSLVIVGNCYLDIHTGLEVVERDGIWQFAYPEKVARLKERDKQHPIEAVPGFMDDYTGASLDRPGLDKMREFIIRESVGAVIVYDLDRLSRRAIHQLLLEEEFAKRDVQVHYVLGQYEDTPEGKLQKQVRGAIAEYEREKIRERMVRGKRGMAKAGLYVPGGSPPYGFQRTKRDGRIYLEIEENESRVVHLIFTWYVRGDKAGQPLSFFRIAEKLKAMGIPSPGVARHSPCKRSSPTHWSVSAIYGIIRSEVYVGVWFYNRYEWSSRGESSGRRPKERPRSEWLSVHVPSMIDRGLWEAAQRRAEENRHRTRPTIKNEYLMQTRLRCAICGYAFTGATVYKRDSRYSYYWCIGKNPINGNQRHGEKCTARRVRADVLDARVWEWLQSILEQPEKVLMGLRGVQKEQQQAHKLLHERLTIINAELDKCNTRLDSLIDLATADIGETTKDLFAEKERDLHQRITALKRERQDAVERINAAVIDDATIQSVASLTEDVKIALANATFKEKRALVEMLDVRGLIRQVDKRTSILELSCILTDTTTYAIQRFCRNDKHNLIQISFDYPCT